MREIVSPLSGIRSPFGQRRDPYKVLGFKPGLVADFGSEYYRATGRTTFDGLVTHAATSNATMVDSDGLLKWRPHNLLTYSEDLTGADWSATGTSSIVDAETITFSTDDGSRLRNSGVSASAGPEHTIEFEYISDGTFEVLARAGAVTQSFNSAPASATETTHTLTIPEGSDAVTILWIRRGSGFTATEVTIRNVRVYRSDLGGMVDNPDRGDSYVPTTSAAVYLPRRGHHVWNGSAWVNEGLLHESEARTNLLPYSEDRTNAGWGNTNVTVTDDGTSIVGLSASKITFGSGSNLFAENVGAVVGDYVTLSAFVARGDLDDHGSNHRFGFYDATATADVGYINFNYGTGVTSVQSGTVFAHDAEEVDGGWRIHMTIAHTTGNTLVAYFGAVGADAGTGYFYLAGPQVE